MENAIIDINYFTLFTGYVIFLIPVGIFWYFKTGLVKPALFSVARMTIQLLLLGLYLEYIFKWNNTWVNLGWVFIMLIIAAYTVVKRSNLATKLFIIPVLLAIGISLLIIDTFFIGYIIRLDYFFEARYFIPITGILLGNCLKTNIIALNAYYTDLDREQTMYRYFLVNGGSRNQALTPFIREAIKKSFNPVIANMSVMGLIFLPGIMTGQILGGASPGIAIKYQIMIMLTIFTSSLLTVVITILLSNRFVFDDFSNLKDGVIKNR
jgi:putative ABC transport system permease protein